MCFYAALLKLKLWIKNERSRGSLTSRAGVVGSHSQSLFAFDGLAAVLVSDRRVK